MIASFTIIQDQAQVCSDAFLSDLRKKRDYQKVYDELEKFKAIRVLESTWCFNRFEVAAKELKIHFENFIEDDDGQIVSQNASWSGMNMDVSPNDLP
jgi:hypothetical protein